MLRNGSRAIATPAFVNDWLRQMDTAYSPILTAYNIGFDWGKCRNTDIDLGIFSQRFDLMMAAKAIIVSTEKYAQACHENDWFTKGGQLSSKADHVARFIDSTLPPEPHTALEDAAIYENAILQFIIDQPTSRQKLLDAGMAKNPSAKWMQA